MSDPTAAWDSLLGRATPLFTGPSFFLFQELLSAWILCPGRRTVTRMIGLVAPEGRRAHDAYHRFLREGAWKLAQLWCLLARMVVGALAPDGLLAVDLDDTLFHKSGPNVHGAGIYRDAVRSVGKKVVYALGLNLVVLTIRVVPPWKGPPLGLPINVRLYRKGGPSHLDLAEEMLREVALWFPARTFRLCADGAYASLAGRPLPRTHFVSRMRRDAALYDLPPRRRKRGPGRPRRKGKRLPSPERLARCTRHGWSKASVDYRGRTKVRLLLSRRVLWYQVCGETPVLLVVVRDPQGREPDDFFFTTEIEADKVAVASQYNGRWSIEDTFRDVKQFLGGEDPQTWKGEGPERAASVALALYSLVWLWYLSTQGTKRTWATLPWYPGKNSPAFPDALACLRRGLWRRRVFARCDRRPLTRKMLMRLIEVLARAA